MKKAAVFATGILTVVFMFSGCQKKKVEEAVEPLVADVLEEGASETVETQEETEAEEEVKDVLVVDRNLGIRPGSRIAVVSKDTTGEFWDQIRNGMEDAVAEVNTVYGFEGDDKISMTFEGPDDELEIEEQINTLDAVIAENPDLLCISIADMNSCQAQMEAARENGIPVIVFDSNVSDTQLIRAFRGTDNVRVGELAAYRLGSAIGKTGKVAVFSAQEKTQSAKDRVDGFLDTIANYTDIEVTDVIYMDQVDDMKTAMQETLENYPNLDGVFCTNADVAEMYLDLDKNEEEHGSAAMVGVDATSRQVEAIRDGEEIGVISQNPYEMGYQTILTALNFTAPASQRQKTHKYVLFDPVWITLDQLDDPSYSQYLYKE